MPLPADRRRLLGAFVRSRREALPAPVAGRRRTPGLRREDVADRCGISTAWYSWDEQGRDIALSPGAPSADFARLWDGRAVATRDGGLRRFCHPGDGILHYEQATLIPASHPDHEIVMLLPCPGRSPA